MVAAPVIVDAFDDESPDQAHARRSHLYALDGLLGFIETAMMESGPSRLAPRHLWARYRLYGGDRPFPIRLGDLLDEVFRIQERWVRTPYTVSMVRPSFATNRMRRDQQAMLNRLREQAASQAALLKGNGPFATNVRRELFHRALATQVVHGGSGRYTPPPVDVKALAAALDHGDSDELERYAADLFIHYRVADAVG